MLILFLCCFLTSPPSKDKEAGNSKKRIHYRYSNTDLHTRIHSATSLNGQEAETTQVSIS